MKHIPRRYFSDTIDFDTRYKLIEDYSDELWDNAKMYLSETKKITTSAIKVSEVIKRNLDIELFPLIIKMATKGFDVAGGTAAFMMIDKMGREYLFADRAKDYKAISGDYEVSNQRGLTWIYRQD